MLDALFKRFVNESPVTVMVGGLLERVLTSEPLDALFERTAEYQYTRELPVLLGLRNDEPGGLRYSTVRSCRLSSLGPRVECIHNLCVQ